MFIADLLFGKEKRKARQTIQTFNPVPREELAEYNFNKGRVRYESGFSNSESFESAKNTFKKFVNNKPIEVLHAANIKKQQMFENVGKVAKKVLVSEYEALCKKFQNSDDLYEDPDFRPNDQSLGKTFARPDMKWVRISELIPNAQFVSDTISPEDVFQGALGNCYFLSAIAALAENDFRVKNIFPNLEINKNGFYMARILHSGVLQQVVVDDYIPVRNGKPFFTKPAGGKQIWVMILQKCWAKLYGSYQITQGGLASQALRAFSGAPTFYNSITEDKQQQDKLFDTLLEANSDGAVMCCGTRMQHEIQDIKQKGLVQGHAYTILEVIEQPYKLVKLRNPWGKDEWNGRASEQDKQFWNRLKAIDKDKLGQKFGNDGIFFMLWQDFVYYFKMIDICKINDNANYFFYEDEYQKDIPKQFQLETSGGQVVISVSQRNLRTINWKEKKKYNTYPTVTIILSRVIEQQCGVDYEYVDSKNDYSFPDTSIAFKDLKPGKYIISVSISWNLSKKDLATVSVYTDTQIKLIDSNISSQQFLYKTYMSRARNNTEYHEGIFRNSTTQWQCNQILADKCGYGYYVLHLQKDSIAKKVILTFNEQEYEDLNMQLLPPYKGKGTFKVTAQPGRDVIILSKLKPGSFDGEFYIPQPKIEAQT